MNKDRERIIGDTYRKLIDTFLEAKKLAEVLREENISLREQLEANAAHIGDLLDVNEENIRLKAELAALKQPVNIDDVELEIVLCKSFDNRQCVYINDHRVYGGKPAIGNNLIGSAKFQLSDIIKIHTPKEPIK